MSVFTTLETDGKKHGNGSSVSATCSSVFRFSTIVVASFTFKTMSFSRLVSRFLDVVSSPYALC